MGLEYDSIKKITQEVWKVIPIQDIKNALTPENILEDSRVHPHISGFNKRYVPEIAEEINSIKEESLGPGYELYLFESIVSSCLFGKEETSLLFRFDGFVSLMNDTPAFKAFGESEPFSIIDFYNTEFTPFPHIRIPIKRYLVDFFNLKSNAGKWRRFDFINEDEFEVLEVIRQGNLKEVTIKINPENNSIKGYEYKIDGDISEEKFQQMTRTFFLKQYESITFKRKDNKTVYFEKTTKKQLNK